MEQDDLSDYSNKAMKLNVLNEAKNNIYTQTIYFFRIVSLWLHHSMLAHVMNVSFFLYDYFYGPQLS